MKDIDPNVAGGVMNQNSSRLKHSLPKNIAPTQPEQGSTSLAHNSSRKVVPLIRKQISYMEELLGDG
jgi:hypothetical protein